MLRDVRGFNVGVQAVASLHKELLPALPPWYDVDDLANEGEFGLPLQQLSDEKHAQAARKKHLPAEPVPVQPVVEVEAQAEMMLQPKDLLASERTEGSSRGAGPWEDHAGVDAHGLRPGRNCHRRHIN